MATKKLNNPYHKLPAASASVPECPVCTEIMCAPIYQCKMGHSLCNSCTKRLKPPLCPICREDMTQMRNWQLEELVSKVPLPCPNKSAGCVYTVAAGEVEDHLKECIFRAMDCPLAVFGKCSWNGQLREMMLHFKDRHPTHCDVSPDEDVTATDVNVKEDERFVYLANLGPRLFTITVKIDTLQKMSYWAIQHIGSKRAAQQHVYEFHITSQLDNRRKVMFADHCFNDNMKTEEIFRLGKCGMLPLDGLANFIKNKTLKFRFLIKKNTFVPKGKNEQQERNEGKPKPHNNNPNFNRNKGPGPGPNRSRNTSQVRKP